MFDPSIYSKNVCPKLIKEFLIDRCPILNRDLLPKMRFANVLNF